MSNLVYGYARISKRTQKIERQINNLEKFKEGIVIEQEAFTGTSINRPVWDKLQRKLKKGDTIIFDSVSRMSRNKEEGTEKYFELLEKGINLVFIKEPHINTDSYKKALEGTSLPTTDNNVVNAILEGVKEALNIMAKNNIELAFEQSEKEVKDIQQRTKEGLREAKERGSQIGQIKGSKLTTKKSIEKKEKIKKIFNKFGGNMNGKETIELLGISRNTFYKYVREIESENN